MRGLSQSERGRISRKREGDQGIPMELFGEGFPGTGPQKTMGRWLCCPCRDQPWS